MTLSMISQMDDWEEGDGDYWGRDGHVPTNLPFSVQRAASRVGLPLLCTHSETSHSERNRERSADGGQREEMKEECQ